MQFNKVSYFSEYVFCLSLTTCVSSGGMWASHFPKSETVLGGAVTVALYNN